MKKYIVCSGLIALVMLIWLFNSCVDNTPPPQDKNSFVKNKNKELTVSFAQDWYEKNNTSSLPIIPRSVPEDVSDNVKTIETKPDWERASESRSGNLEVVETPLLVREGGAMFMDSETSEQFDSEADEERIYNIARMVVLKHLDTGEIYHFTMVFVGKYAYLKQSETFSENSYLSRTDDFEGDVLYFEPNGSFVHGWRYEDGVITNSILPATEEAFQISTKGGSYGEDCWTETTIIRIFVQTGGVEYDKELGKKVAVVIAHTVTYVFHSEVCTPGGGDDGGGSRPIGGGGRYTPPTDKEKEKKEQRERKKKVETAINKNCGLKKLLDELRGFDNLSGGFVNVDGETAAYYPKKKQIGMYPGWNGEYSPVLGEEVTHFIQDHKYPGGIGQYYGKPGETNIEFEGQVIADIYSFMRDDELIRRSSRVLVGIPDKYISTEEYKDFLKSIRDSTMTDSSYLDMLEKFNNHTHHPSAGKVDKELKPFLLNNYGKSFFLKDCK